MGRHVGTLAVHQDLNAYVAPDPRIGSPRDVCMRCVVNAVLYLAKTGCQWRMLPTNFPNYGTVYHHFRRWRADAGDLILAGARLGLDIAREGVI